MGEFVRPRGFVEPESWDPNGWRKFTEVIPQTEEGLEAYLNTILPYPVEPRGMIGDFMEDGGYRAGGALFDVHKFHIRAMIGGALGRLGLAGCADMMPPSSASSPVTGAYIAPHGQIGVITREPIKAYKPAPGIRLFGTLPVSKVIEVGY